MGEEPFAHLLHEKETRMNVSKTHTAEETTKGVPQPWEDLPDKDAPKTSDVDTERAALIGSRCAACGDTAFPARRVCIDCGGDRLSKVTLPTEGTLYSYSTVRVSAARPTPYTLGYVDLAGDVRILAHIVGPEETLRPDIPVRLTIAENDDWAFTTELTTRPEEKNHA